MEDFFMMTRPMMQQIINTLKTLDVRGYESMDKLVGCVMLLEAGMNPPKEENPEEKAESKTETE